MRRERRNLLWCWARSAKEHGAWRRGCGGVGMLVIVVGLFSGCGRSVPEGSLILTQVPISIAETFVARDLMELRYPPGTRIALAEKQGDWRQLRVLSADLLAAGSPVLSACGERVLFTGKARGAADWQIYETRLKSGKPRQLSTMPGGAMDPAYLPDGRFLFSSPVPSTTESPGSREAPAIYAQSLEGGKAEQLTFGLAGAMASTVLADGRVLFASGGAASVTVTNQSLFTVNNDGTELTGYAGQHDGAVQVWRPRELPDGRIVFLSADWGSAPVEGRVEQVFTARPYSSRAPALAGVSWPIRSIEPTGNGGVWVTARDPGADGQGRYAVHRILEACGELGEPWFDHPEWHEVEAVGVVARKVPMGRLSTIKPEYSTGMFLCLDANDTSYVDSDGTVPLATHIRLSIAGTEDQVHPLGVVPVLADGSFLVEVPADRAIGFEALDKEGQVLRRVAPIVWLRPGENRACVGCHEPHNMAPDNRRPLAVKERVVPLSVLLESIAQTGVHP
jgi:hypothetical protein